MYTARRDHADDVGRGARRRGRSGSHTISEPLACSAGWSGSCHGAWGGHEERLPIPPDISSTHGSLDSSLEPHSPVSSRRSAMKSVATMVPGAVRPPGPGRRSTSSSATGLAAQGRCRRGDPGRVHLQSWAGDIIAILREAHQAVQDACARGSTPSARTCWTNSIGATSRPPRSGSPTTGCGTGTWEPPRLRAGLLATRLQILQAAPCRLRLLASARRPRPLVPHQKLPRVSNRPRHHRTRRHPWRTHRKPWLPRPPAVR
jgi:hypothetical protein